MKKIKLTEDRIIQALTEYLSGCDADELARLTGNIFGGECFCKAKKVKRAHWSEYVNTYEFEPNFFYGGEFGEI